MDPPIIFLDIDGVLNHETFYIKRGKNTHLKFPHSQICSYSISHLNNITNKTGAQIVISSVWRGGRTLEELKEIFETVGATGEIIGFTPKGCCNCFRGNEIFKWQKDNNRCPHTSKFVILDDDSDMLYWQKDNFIHIRNKFGLTYEDSQNAVKILL